MATDPSNRQDSAAVGCVILVIVLGFVVYGIYRAYYSYKGYDQPGVVTLAAYFVDSSGNPVVDGTGDDGHLKIRGTVSQAGKLLDEGNVRLTVAKTDDSFEQTVAIDAKGGQFESEDAAFRPLKPSDKLHITAEVSSTRLAALVTQEVYLNTPQPLTTMKIIILWSVSGVAVILILVLFFRSFTGQRNPRKNRNAIIFSYLFGGVFLAVPLLAPILLLKVFPEVRRAMIGMPVGLVLTKLPVDNKVQWALNIGGYSHLPATKSETATGSPTPTPAPTATATPASSPTPTSRPTQNATSGASPTPGTQPTASPAGTSAKTSAASEIKSEEWDGVVELEGGLVIPLYVIILSVIGGAINMTRKVPRFQGEGEYYEPTAFRPSLSPWANVKKFGSTILGGFSKESPTAAASEPDESTKTETANVPESSEQPSEAPVAESETKTDAESAAQPSGQQPAADKPEDPETALNDKAKVIDAQLEDLVTRQVLRNSDTREFQKQIQDKVQDMQKVFDQKTDDQRVLGFDSFEAWYGSRVNLKEVLGTNWRVDLLNQYMYLISAPFLAIVAYYMLDLLSLTKQPILVLISFSVGLISERILSWLLGLASGYLRTSPNQSSAKP